LYAYIYVNIVVPGRTAVAQRVQRLATGSAAVVPLAAKAGIPVATTTCRLAKWRDVNILATLVL
jgi:hypothetical protein